MDETKEAVKKYMKKYLAEGHDINTIAKAFKEKGYPKEEIKQAVKELKAKTAEPEPAKGPPITEKIREMIPTKALIAVLGLVIIVAGAWLLISNIAGVKDCGYDKVCFINYANQCSPATVRDTFVGSTVQYTTDDCILRKEVVEFDDEEPVEVQALFKDKTMVCEYSQGNFNSAYVDNLLGGIDICNGNLKDIIYELRIAQYTVLY